MPSTTEVAQQFDTIEDTIAAFSEFLPHTGYIQIVSPRILTPARLPNDFVTDDDSPREW